MRRPWSSKKARSWAIRYSECLAVLQHKCVGILVDGRDSLEMLGLESGEFDRQPMAQAEVRMTAEVAESLALLLGHMIAVRLVHRRHRREPFTRAKRLPVHIGRAV